MLERVDLEMDSFGGGQITSCKYVQVMLIAKHLEDLLVVATSASWRHDCDCVPASLSCSNRPAFLVP